MAFVCHTQIGEGVRKLRIALQRGVKGGDGAGIIVRLQRAQAETEVYLRGPRIHRGSALQCRATVHDVTAQRLGNTEIHPGGEKIVLVGEHAPEIGHGILHSPERRPAPAPQMTRFDVPGPLREKLLANPDGDLRLSAAQRGAGPLQFVVRIGHGQVWCCPHVKL